MNHGLLFIEILEILKEEFPEPGCVHLVKFLEKKNILALFFG